MRWVLPADIFRIALLNADGNAEVGLYPNTTNNLTYAKGLMECINFGNGYGVDGPHVQADLEMGVYVGANKNVSYKAINASFVTAVSSTRRSISPPPRDGRRLWRAVRF